MHGSLASRLWCVILSVAVAALVQCTARPADAGMILTVQSVSANTGTSGNTLEVDVQNTGAPVDIAAFSFEISVPVGSGITLTGADINTSSFPYIFAGNSAQGPDIGSAAGTDLIASDNAVAGSTALGTGTTLALGRVTFDVDSSAPLGPVTVSLADFPATSLTAPDFSNIPIDVLTNGTITIQRGTAVPEPSALVSASLGLLGAAWLIRRKRSTANNLRS